MKLIIPISKERKEKKTNPFLSEGFTAIRINSRINGKWKRISTDGNNKNFTNVQVTKSNDNRRYFFGNPKK